MIKQMVLVVLGALAWAGPAASTETAKPEEAIKYRRAVMTEIKWHADRLAAMARGDQPFNRDAAVKHSSYLEMLSRVAIDGYIPGTAEGDTKVKPEIWKEWDKFRAGMEKFQSEAAKLRDVGRTGDVNALKAQLGESQKTCKSCHDNYRAAKLLS